MYQPIVKHPDTWQREISDACIIISIWFHLFMVPPLKVDLDMPLSAIAPCLFSIPLISCTYSFSCHIHKRNSLWERIRASYVSLSHHYSSQLILDDIYVTSTKYSNFVERQWSPGWQCEHLILKNSTPEKARSQRDTA